MAIFATAVGDGLVYDTASLQQSIDLAQTTKQRLILGEGKTYLIDQPLIIRQGRISSDLPTFELDIEGNGSKIINAGTGYAIEIQPLASLNLAINPEGGVNAAGSISINNLDVVPPTTINTKKGIKIGRENYMMYANARRVLLNNVDLTQLGGRTLEIINAGHFDICRVTQRDDMNGVGEGLYLAALGENAFCGDISFIDCQFQGNVLAAQTNKPMHITTYSANNQKPASARGIRFDRCVFYGNGAKIEASLNGKTCDIWMDNCAWDGPSGAQNSNAGHGLEITANNGGLIDKLYINNPYVVNYQACGFILSDDAPSKMRDIRISGGSVSMTREPIKIVGANGVTVENLAVTNCLDIEWALINVTPGSKNIIVRGCSESDNGNGAGKVFIAVGDQTSNNIVVEHNNSFSPGFTDVVDYLGNAPSMKKRINFNTKF
jgi:hypothetical protein